MIKIWNIFYIFFLFILLLGLIFYFRLTFNFPYQFALNSRSKVDGIKLYINDALVDIINLNENEEKIISTEYINPVTNKLFNRLEINKITIYLPAKSGQVNFRNINIVSSELICSRDLAGLNRIECSNIFEPENYYTFKI
jgi:hypothetical protein